jgi:hypothetical protein
MQTSDMGMAAANGEGCHFRYRSVVNVKKSKKKPPHFQLPPKNLQALEKKNYQK